MTPSISARLASSAGASAGATPSRLMPVSTLTWSETTRPAARAAAARPRAVSTSHTTGASRASTTVGEVGAVDAAEHDDRPLHAGGAEIAAFGGGRDREALGAGVAQHAPDQRQAVAVGVGLHHRQHAAPGRRCARARRSCRRARARRFRRRSASPAARIPSGVSSRSRKKSGPRSPGCRGCKGSRRSA